MQHSVIPWWLSSRESSHKMWPIHSDMCKQRVQFSKEKFKFRYLFRAPFDSAILSFIAMCALLITTWTENYGDASAPVMQSFVSAWNAIKSGKVITTININNHVDIFQIEKFASLVLFKLFSKHQCTFSFSNGRRH